MLSWEGEEFVPKWFLELQVRIVMSYNNKLLYQFELDRKNVYNIIVGHKNYKF